MKHFKFKQAVKFEAESGRKFFSLGIHAVPSEVEKLDYFQLLMKHGLIVESGAPAPSHQESQKIAIDKKMAQSEEAKADASESGDVASNDAGNNDSSEASNEVSEEKESRKNRKNRR